MMKVPVWLPTVAPATLQTEPWSCILAALLFALRGNSDTNAIKIINLDLKI